MSDVYKENYDLRKRIAAMTCAFGDIYLALTCIGGPFNDNAHGYTKKQLKELRPILAIAESFLSVES